jgi:hypothetical protein
LGFVGEEVRSPSRLQISGEESGDKSGEDKTEKKQAKIKGAHHGNESTI